MDGQEGGPPVRVPLRGHLQPALQVEVDGVRDVARHGHDVGHGDGGENAVYRRPHGGPRQDEDVQHVGDDAERADDETEVAVHVPVPVRVHVEVVVDLEERLHDVAAAIAVAAVNGADGWYHDTRL